MNTAAAHEQRRDSEVWAALADSTRRSLIDRLASGPKTTSSLCCGASMTRFGVMKHLRVLENAGLVVVQKRGRQTFNYLNAARLHGVVSGWMSGRSTMLASSVERMLAKKGETSMNPDSHSVLPGIVDVALQWEVAASVQRLWHVLISQPGSWWPKSHRALEGESDFLFEDRLGGQLRETATDGSGVLWYTVFAIQPRRSIDLVGNLAARYGGPATSTLGIQLLPGTEESTTILRLSDSLVGRVGPDTHANVTRGWQSIMGDGLIAMLGRGSS